MFAIYRELWIAGGALLLLTLAITRKHRPQISRRALAHRAIWVLMGLVLVTGILWFFLPTVPSLAHTGRGWDAYHRYHRLAQELELLQKNHPRSMHTLEDVRRAIGQLQDPGWGSRALRNPFTGSFSIEEDSPGNYTLSQTDSGLMITFYNAVGQAVRPPKDFSLSSPAPE